MTDEIGQIWYVSNTETHKKSCKNIIEPQEYIRIDLKKRFCTILFFTSAESILQLEDDFRPLDVFVLVINTFTLCLPLKMHVTYWERERSPHPEVRSVSPEASYPGDVSLLKHHILKKMEDARRWWYACGGTAWGHLCSGGTPPCVRLFRVWQTHVSTVTESMRSVFFSSNHFLFCQTLALESANSSNVWRQYLNLVLIL